MKLARLQKIDAMDCPYCERGCLHEIDRSDNPEGLSSRPLKVVANG